VLGLATGGWAQDAQSTLPRADPPFTGTIEKVVFDVK